MSLSAKYHDIGKIKIPDSILNKPGKLSISEMKIVKKHVIYGAEILKEKGFNDTIVKSVLYHHEKFDGTGYIGLKGYDIPFYSRIIAIADSYDAMINYRPYNKIKNHAEAIEEIKKNSGTQFDPELVAQFLRMATKNINAPKFYYINENNSIRKKDNYEISYGRKAKCC